tara:strand:+ start:293 stop:436 length:144 start_codon:yes stop_codon:yes gene_type:complete
MNKPEHVKEVKKATVKAHKTYMSWMESETSLQKAIYEFLAVMKKLKT